MFLAATVTTMQVTGTWKVYAADTLKYTGTTEISTVEVCTLADTSAVELEVEEVYIEEGTQLTKGDPILKITDDIVTEDVIITDNQIKHIRERHPNDYERFAEYFSEIIADPDYILEANRSNTAFVLKQIFNNNIFQNRN